jgi:hypothetical protein
MPTLVLAPRYTQDSNRLWQAALTLAAQGWNVQRLHSHQAPPELIEQDVVLYGEGLFVRVIAEQLGLALFEPPAHWLSDLPAEHRLRDVHLTTLAEARSLSGKAFIKPALDKSFDARVYDSGAELPASEYFDDATPTLVSEPVMWEIEYRCFITDRQLRTLAPYVRNRETLTDDSGEWQTSAPEDDEAAAFINVLLADVRVSLPPAVVVDVGKIAGRGWAVIEANPAWASGLYGNDALAVLRVVQRSLIRQHDLPPEFRRWMLEG